MMHVSNFPFCYPSVKIEPEAGIANASSMKKFTAIKPMGGFTSLHPRAKKARMSQPSPEPIENESSEDEFHDCIEIA